MRCASKSVILSSGVALIISIILQPSYILGTETPLREGGMMPSSTPATPPPQGQYVDAQGDRILTYQNPRINVKIQMSIPKEYSFGESLFAEGFFRGYHEALFDHDAAYDSYNDYIKNVDKKGQRPYYQDGYLKGLNSVMEKWETFNDIIEILGTPTKQPPPETPSGPPPTAKPPAGPPT
jgi:hypothetical protein